MPKLREGIKRIRVSAAHPIWAEVEVEYDENDETWQIKSVLRSGCEVTVRSLNEAMSADDIDEMDRKADFAPKVRG